jgi:hypothetical protein
MAIEVGRFFPGNRHNDDAVPGDPQNGSSYKKVPLGKSKTDDEEYQELLALYCPHLHTNENN